MYRNKTQPLNYDLDFFKISLLFAPSPCSGRHGDLDQLHPDTSHLWSASCLILSLHCVLFSCLSLTFFLCACPRFFTGVAYFHDCPQHPNIPNYLLGLAMMTLLMIPFVTFPCESFAPREHPRGFKLCLLLLISLANFILGLAGRDFPHNTFFLGFLFWFPDVTPL